MIRVISGAALAASAIALVTCCSPTPDQNYLAACESAIKARLVAPSGYRRIDDVGVVSKTEMHYSQFAQGASRIGFHLQKSDYDSLGQTSSPTLILYQRLIEYDAPNSFNAPIRSTAWCLFFSIDGKPESVSPERIALTDEKGLLSILKP